MKKAVLMGLILGAFTTGGYAGESDGIFSFKVRQFEVHMIVEAQRDGNADILVGADEALLKRYIPETGFKHTANAFLIKGPRHTFLIDTGTGAGGIVVEKIQKLGIDPKEIDAVLITHLHGDHFGSLQKDGKAVFPNAKIFLSAKEHEYFTKTAPNQGAIAALAPYDSNIITFTPADIAFAASGQKINDLVPGIRAIAAYGHTPGHTIFQLHSGSASLLIVADLLHVALVQFPAPDISATYDMDKEEAASTRRQVLDYAAKNKIPIGGMHIVYPAVGSVETDGNGFKFTPAR